MKVWLLIFFITAAFRYFEPLDIHLSNSSSMTTKDHRASHKGENRLKRANPSEERIESVGS